MGHNGSKSYQPVSNEYTSSRAVPTELIPPWIKIFFPTHAAAWAVLDEGAWPVGSSLLQVLFTTLKGENLVLIQTN